MMKRWLPHIGIAIGVAIAIYALFYSSSDEDLIGEKLEQLEEAVAVRGTETNLVVRTARVRKQFSEIFIKQVTFRIPELSRIQGGRTELAGLAARAPQLYATATVDLGGLDIAVDESGSSAAAHGEATLTATRHSGELQRDTRTVMLRFDKIDDDWRIVSVSVSAKTDTESVLDE
jgi:hypothetical protein